MVAKLILLGSLSLTVSFAHGWTLLASGLKGWQASTITIYINSSGCPITYGEIAAAVDTAITSWNAIPAAGLTLKRAEVESTTDVTTFRASGAPDTPLVVCDPNFATNNHTDADFVPAATRVGSANPLNYGGISLNSQTGAAANVSRISAPVLAVIMAHELGHVLGLGHSSSSGALMYYSVSGKREVTLTDDDRDGITYLYPRGVGHQPFGCAAVHSPEGAAKRCFPWLMTMGLGVVFSVIARRLAARAISNQT